MISLTANAAEQIRSQLAKRGRGLGLRVGIKQVGCSGFAYTFDFADEVGPGDRLFESHGTAVVVDAEALPFLQGARLDYVKQGFGAAFKFDNPNVESSCGCGESFSVKQP